MNKPFLESEVDLMVNLLTTRSPYSHFLDGLAKFYCMKFMIILNAINIDSMESNQIQVYLFTYFLNYIHYSRVHLRHKFDTTQNYGSF